MVSQWSSRWLRFQALPVTGRSVLSSRDSRHLGFRNGKVHETYRNHARIKAYPIGTSSSRSPFSFKVPIILIFGVPKWFQNLQTCIIMDPFAAGNLLRCCCSEGVCRDGYRMGHPLCQWALRKKGPFLDMFCIKHHQTIHFLGSKWIKHFEQSLWTRTCCDVGTPYRISISEYPGWHERITFRSPRLWVAFREHLQKIKVIQTIVSPNYKQVCPNNQPIWTDIK